MSFDTTPKAIAKAFGAALCNARKATGRTPEQAADLLFCEHGFYRRLEDGQSLPSLYLAARAVDLLGVDPVAALGAYHYDSKLFAARQAGRLEFERAESLRAELAAVRAQGAESIAALRQECEALQAELGRVRADRDAAIAAALAMPEVP